MREWVGLNGSWDLACEWVGLHGSFHIHYTRKECIAFLFTSVLVFEGAIGTMPCKLRGCDDNYY